MIIYYFSIHSNTRYEIDTTLSIEMYWFVVWSFVAVFSYNYNAADANACITRGEIDRLKVELKGHIDEEISDIITDDGMYHLLHFIFHTSLTGSSYECSNSPSTLCQLYRGIQSVLLVEEANNHCSSLIHMAVSRSHHQRGPGGSMS